MPSIVTSGAASARAFGLFKAAVSGAVTDAFFKYVTMLLPGNGTNGAQNKTFLDSSTNNFTITRNGNTTQGTFSPYGPNWSAYVNGAEVTAGSNSAFAFGTGAYTVELWIFQSLALSAYGAGQGPCFVFCDATGGFGLWNNVSTGITIDTRAGSSILTSSTQLPVNQWNHVVAVRSGTGAGQTSIFLNGTRIANGTDATNYTITGPLKIGGISIGGYYAVGNISNVRIVKGSAVYDPTQSTLTVPTSPLTAVSGTSLLTCQSNRLIDNSSNAFSISYSGSPAPVIQRFSPFSPSAAYSTTTNGGSGYLDGSGDSLVTAASATLGLGSGAFTIEGWFYRTASGDIYLADYGSESTNRMSILVFSNTLQVYDTGYKNSGLNVPLNQWNHFAYVRSGTTVTPYLNGVAGTTYTDSRNLAKTATWYVGCDDTLTSNFTGYMSDFRIVVGTAIYTAAFTPPTTPLTAVTNTKLLLNMTNAGIIDNAMMNDLETVGNAQISTTQSKFGGSSIYFDGTGDILQAPQNQIYAFGTGDFTIEFWVYPNSWTATASTVVRIAGSSDWVCQFDGSGILNFYNGATTVLTDTASPSTGTWTHFAIVRSGSTMKLYRNGTSTVSATHSSSVGCTNVLLVGCGGNSNNTLYCLNGYIDDLRITKGYARYTANFTPPTAAFPTS